MGKEQSILGKPSIKFYKDLKQSNTIKVEGDGLKKQIKMKVRIEKGEDEAMYSINIYADQQNRVNLLSTSQQRANSSGIIDFQEFLLMEYYFEKEQSLFIQINKNGYLLESFKTTVGTVFGSRNNTHSKQLNSSELIVISSEPLSDTTEYLYIKLQCENLTENDLRNPKLLCYYLISTNTKIYQSETISINGVFNETRIPSNLLSPQFTIQFFNYKKKCVYTLNTNINDFVNQTGPFNKLSFDIRKDKKMIFTNKSRAMKDYNFMEYIRAGVRLGLDIAIDFTNSNGHPLQVDSLHRVAEGVQNDYEKAIYSCGNIVAQYDYDQMFPVFGFGAKIRDDTEVSMCFNITLTDNSYINRIDGVLREYHNVLRNITFSGPTYFSPIIRQVISDIRHEGNSLNYHILMILTDGVINDMNESIDALVEGSFMPLSVIIIGIGNADFTNMDILDADDNPLVDSRGRKSARDLVQFVPFNQFKNDPNKLSSEVLEEIPTQIVEYYSQNNMYPDNLAS